MRKASHAEPVDLSTGSPALLARPSKLFVETTTRCNLGCLMCVKQSCDHGIAEGDMSASTFAALEPAFPNLSALILNGIGEPLINPLLDDFVGRARRLMPADGWIGFQSNGLLLTELRAVSLLHAGLDRLCLSIDSISPETFRKLREGGEVEDVQHAFTALAAAKRTTGRTDFKIGVEFVVTRANLRELPDALAWAVRRGASFALVTHALPYDQQHGCESLYGGCSDEALQLFGKWREEAEREGIDIYRYYNVVVKYSRSPEEQRICALVDALKAEAEGKGVFLDLKKLLRLNWREHQEVEEVFERAQEVADRLGLELKLPSVVLNETRHCGFVEEGGAFVTWNGAISPCYFLWHRYTCFASGWSQPVQPKVFGNVNERDIVDIWNDKAFRSFREGVIAYDYPHCSSCGLAPCDYVQTESFEQDCHIREVPCGACLWCTGIFQCMT
ncbi:radical SAM/SPASM family putative metalloenzyme maturase [Geomonas sp.]|uniref:radical SAM/SPASM family putative metalloenzyme maturase n=1 Tax=Geomonas sp. TaxID=2651584 RepID=UPI002B494F59|nr:radical SAM/SPASM family putative metalloenzyme maturase [Geomonas sp.]HJV36474.1 radical SAM/SPASM family putative metalloenzyme maturase [Geomonas sp.]